MAKCLIVYFSLGGTTRKIAEAVARGLTSQRHHVDLHDLRHGPPPDQGKYDALGIGSPTHYYRPALTVSEYLGTLPDLSGKPVFSFVLHAAYVGDAGNLVRRALEEKGGKEVGYALHRGAGRFLGYLKHGYQFSPNHPTPDAITQAELFGREVAAHMAGKAYARPEPDARPAFIYRLERRLTSPFYIQHLYSRLFRADVTRCSGCGQCVKRCPSRNISENADGTRSWGRDCILCFDCEANCPNEAIASRVTWLLFWPFMVYNTRSAGRDPAIEHVRVVHANGRTTSPSPPGSRS